MALLVVEPGRLCGEGIGRRRIAERTSIGTVGIVDAIWHEGAPFAKRIGDGIGIIGIRAEVPQVVRLERSRHPEQDDDQRAESLHGDLLSPSQFSHDGRSWSPDDGAGEGGVSLGINELAAGCSSPRR